ncbi:EAL domain-containing protein [Candidatus Uabimicrobium sp. HlEnr_7]|uniref:EAL domain-containing protein n=1 Tax=Candidatus Uabimicrobium helgolandensis TaxID=3095367 RepID=UPI0035581759
MEIILAVKLGLKPGTKIKIDIFPAMFGSASENTFSFSELGVATQHFLINKKDNKIFLRPMEGKVTLVNNIVVETKVELTNLDYITVSEDLILQIHFTKKISRRTSKGYDQIKMKPGGVLRQRIDVEKTSILEPSTQTLKYSHKALKAIYTVLRKCNSESNDELLFDRLLDALFEAVDAERGAIFLQTDKDNYEGRSFLNSMGERDEFPVSSTVLKDVLENRVSIISHIPEEERLNSSESIRMQMVGSFICAPLISYEKIFGALYLDRTILHNQPQLVEEGDGSYPKPFIIEDLELLVAIGIQIGGSLAKSLLIRKVRKSLIEKEKLVQALGESEERYALAARAANDGLWDCNIESGEVYYSTRWKSMLGYEDDEIQPLLDEWFGKIHEEDFSKVKQEFDEHVAGNLPRFQIEHRMLHRNGSYIWVLNQGIAVRNNNDIITRVVGSQTDITKRKQAEAQLLHDAFYDILTGLPNRALLMSRLQRAIYRANRSEKYIFAVLFMDLDSFKVINDSMGHVTGDELLVAIANRLKKVIRPGDTVARFGGDEFTILLENLQSIEQASEIADILNEGLAEPFTLNDQDFFMGASIGIAIGNTNYEDPQDLLRDADTAMYRAKSRGKPYEVFDKQMHESVIMLLRLETDLRKSLVEQDFFLCYQPIVDLKTFQITGMESLMRWQHKERGLVSPGEFIPLAERTKLIIDLGWWAIREACQQLAIFQKEFSRPDLSVSVNMSAKQFAIHDLGHLIEEVVNQSSINTNSLKLEITETVLMENAKAMIKTLTDLKLMNLDLYIDDFGTGYSSLSYLHRFPISILKVDRSFICEITKKENFEIVRTIITLAHNLDMKVVAEGIETLDQLKLLMKLGCNYGQGNLFSVPVRNNEIAKMLSKSHRWDFL